MFARLGIGLLVAAGCGSSASMSSSSAPCDATQVEVDYITGTRDGEMVCKPLPPSCGATASCSVTACIRDMYSYCDAPYLGVGCSDTFPPTIISCNP